MALVERLVAFHGRDLLGNVRFQNPQVAKMSECPQCDALIDPANSESYMHNCIFAQLNIRKILKAHFGNDPPKSANPIRNPREGSMLTIFPGTARHIAVGVRLSRENHRDIISKDYEYREHVVG